MADRQADVARIQQVKQAYEHELLAKANVVGVGVGLRQRGQVRTDEVVLVVMVERKVPSASLRPTDVIPSELDGVPVDVQAVGRITPQEN